jgi:hypothetical protein
MQTQPLRRDYDEDNPLTDEWTSPARDQEGDIAEALVRPQGIQPSISRHGRPPGRPVVRVDAAMKLRPLFGSTAVSWP